MLALVHETLALAPAMPPFTLLSLGSTNKHRTFGDAHPASLRLSLKACGLTAPAATLLLQWKKEKHGKEEEQSGVCAPTEQPPKDTAAWVPPELLGMGGASRRRREEEMDDVN